MYRRGTCLPKDHRDWCCCQYRWCTQMAVALKAQGRQQTCWAQVLVTEPPPKGHLSPLALTATSGLWICWPERPELRQEHFPAPFPGHLLLYSAPTAEDTSSILHKKALKLSLSQVYFDCDGNWYDFSPSLSHQLSHLPGMELSGEGQVGS